MRLGWIEIQNEAYLLVFHDIMASTFKIGGNRRFFGVYIWSKFVRCRGGNRAIPVPVLSHIPVADVIEAKKEVQKAAPPQSKGSGKGCTRRVPWKRIYDMIDGIQRRV